MMAADHRLQVEELFKAAIEIDPGDRAAWLAQACAGDELLRAEVEAMLATNASLGSFLESPLPPVSSAAAVPHDALLGTRIGQYRIVRAIGSGGMGTVYEAEQEKPRRRVALKLLRWGLASEAALRRFAHEPEILGRLRHPGIAQIYEAGTHVQGALRLPYFAMEYIPGADSITAYARKCNLSTRQRLALLVQVCDAVHHGHQRGIIHRDLKPSNILIDESGRPKVIDFGVARSTDADITISTLQTDVGQIVGTLRYMSPEQCEGDAIEIDTRSDVYALGVVLFELLTGELPYELPAASPFEVPRVIRQEEPRRLSALNRMLRGDVETIVLKALEKDRSRRYQSALELGQDIQRYLNNEPIEASRGRRWYVLRKTIARHRVAAGIIALVLLITATSAIGLGLMYRSAESQRARAEQSADVARRSEYFKTIALAHEACKSANTAGLRELLDQCPPDLRGWEWHYLHRLSDTSLMTLHGGAESVSIALSPDGTLLASTTWGRRIRLWDALTGRGLPGFVVEDNDVENVAFSPDGRWLAAGGRPSPVIRLWNTATGAVERGLAADDQLTSSFAFSPDKSSFAVGATNGEILVWDAATGAPARVLRGHRDRETCVAWSPRGDRLVSGNWDATLKVWDARKGVELMTLTGHTHKVQRVAFSPTGRHIASTSWDNTVRIWDAETGELLHTCDGQGGALAFSPDGTRVAARHGVALMVWDVETGRPEAARLGHTRVIESVAFHPDGKRIFTGSADETIKLWDAQAYDEPFVLRGHQHEVRDVAVSPDGTIIASASRDDTIRLWDVRTRKELSVIRGPGGDVETIAFSPDGRRLASAGDDRVIRIWDIDTGNAVAASAAHPSAVNSIAWSSGKSGPERIASAGWDGTLRLWDPSGGAAVLEVSAHAGVFRGLAFSSDGRCIVTAGGDGAARVWDVEHGTRLREMVIPDEFLQCAAFSPDDTLIACGGNDTLIYVWSAETGRLLRTLTGHADLVQEVVFCPDGTRLISSGYGYLVKVWDTDTGTCLLTLRGHELGIPGLAVSPDGRWFVTAGNDRTLRLWDAGHGD